MHHPLHKLIPSIVGVLVVVVWANAAAADTICAEVNKLVAQSNDFVSLKGEAMEGERFKAKTQITGFRECTVTPFRNKFSYTCETAPEINRAGAAKKWTALQGQLEKCLKGSWLQRGTGKESVFFADRKKGEAMSLSLQEVAGFKRVGNQLQTFPSYYSRLTMYPRKKMKKKAN